MELLLNVEPLIGQRLIAKAVASLPEVRRAFESETVVVNAGTTSVLVFYELTGKLPEGAMAAGLIVRKGLCSDAEMRAFLLKHGYGASWVFKNGELLREYKLQSVVREFSERDVFIKGGNAVDPTGLAGGFLATENYGTLQVAMPVILAKGAHLIVPVSLQKAILGSVMRNCPKMGIRRIDWSIGLPTGYIPIVGADGHRGGNLPNPLRPGGLSRGFGGSVGKGRQRDFLLERKPEENRPRVGDGRGLPE